MVPAGQRGADRLIGAHTPAQLEENLGALDVELDAAHLTRLDEISAIAPVFPHSMLSRDMTRTVISGDLTIQARA